MDNTHPLDKPGTKIHICDPGVRVVRVPHDAMRKRNGGHYDTVQLEQVTLAERGLVYAGYHERSDTWYYAES